MKNGVRSHRAFDPRCCQQRPSRRSVGRDAPAECEGRGQQGRCEHSQNRESRAELQRGAWRCPVGRRNVDQNGRKASRSKAKAAIESTIQNRRYGRKKNSAKPVGTRATTPKTARKRSASPKAYIPADACASGPLVLAIRMSRATDATSTAAT